MFLHIFYYCDLKLMSACLASFREPADKFEAYLHSSCGNVCRNNIPLFSPVIMIKYRKSCTEQENIYETVQIETDELSLLWFRGTDYLD